MCGIIGYTGRKKAAPIILDGLKRLEYRGYDSAGIALLTRREDLGLRREDYGFQVVKQKGRLAALEENPKTAKLEGFTGIGHTRWATHGEPSDINSHPHLGGSNRVAIVHNGIIENYKQLKAKLESKGARFVSQTDSEVIAQLAEHYYSGDLIDALIKTFNALQGSFALGVMCVDNPDIIIAVRKDNPLIIGVSEHGNFIASDVPAVLNHTNKVYYMEDGEIAVINKDEVTFINSDKEVITKPQTTVTWGVDDAEKGGYPHFMLKEITEQPKVLNDTVNITFNEGENKKTIDKIDFLMFNRIVITACGSAYNAGLCGRYVFEKLCRRSVEVELASEFRYKDPIIDEKTLVILVSQSGETADTIAAMREAKARGAATLGIVNVIGSTIAKESALCLFTAAGPEIAVATTKAFSAQLILLYALALKAAANMGRLTEGALLKLEDEIRALPAKAAEILENVDVLQKYSSNCIGYKSVFFIGRNIDYAIAAEGSLKLKEISYIHSEAYAGGELKHGTISLIEDNTLVVTISNNPALHGKIMSNAEQVISRGANVLLLGNCGGARFEDCGNEKITFIKLPCCHELFSPSLSAIALQLFAYYIAANKGLDVDKPRNLAKSVTVE
ncbi:MAG: glutamine--fructose-6-phosphate transaminase (isomerizing) [Oscillospiraceae bacterium]|nr:glutamine--fructose-6-phosphate transaminase (isomerizing) [Oscillospiraceae bacterium]